MGRIGVLRRVFWIALLVLGGALLPDPAPAQGTFRAKPPAVLTVTRRRNPDFEQIKFLSAQRSFQSELRTQLLASNVIIRKGRSVTPMPTLGELTEPTSVAR